MEMESPRAGKSAGAGNIHYSGRFGPTTNHPIIKASSASSAPAMHTHQVGWCYSQAGTAVVYFMALDDPSEADMMVPMDNWWNALRFAMSFARCNPNYEFVGGPSND